MDVAVILPALNEAETLPGVLRRLPRGYTTIVVDNGSTDRTAELAREGGAVVVAAPSKGYGSACLAGLSWVENHGGAEVIVILDADGADDPALLPTFVDRIVADEVDLVLSTRTQGGAEPGALTAVQRVGNRVQCEVINRRWGLQLTDMGPMRAIRGSSLRELRMEDATWGWNVEMACKAARAGLRIVEVPVSYRRRQGGESKISGSVRGATRAGGRILWALWRYAR